MSIRVSEKGCAATLLSAGGSGAGVPGKAEVVTVVVCGVEV